MSEVQPDDCPERHLMLMSLSQIELMVLLKEITDVNPNGDADWKNAVKYAIECKRLEGTKH